ncbi:MAG: T9SS type A sorting domain-containing protein [bacterium]
MEKRILFTFLIIIIALALFAGNNDADSNYKQRLQVNSPGSPDNGAVVKPLYGSKYLIYQQLVDTTTASGHASQLDTVHPFIMEFVDDIEVNEFGWFIDSITTWWNNWNGFSSWDSVGLFYVCIYEDSGLVAMPKDSALFKYPVDSSSFSAPDSSHVDLYFNPPIYLDSNKTYWIGILPVNIFSTNGQTGLLAADGIGNNQEAYFRGDILGYPDWTTATTVHGGPREIGMIIYGGNTDTVVDMAVTVIDSPPVIAARGDYPLLVKIANLGSVPADCQVKAIVYDTTDMWNSIFYDSVSLTGIMPISDTLYDFGTVTFNEGHVYYTNVFITTPDENPANDTMDIYHRTTAAFGDIIFEMEAESICGDNRLLGVEFDGEYFYITGANNGSDTNKVYVVDTAGTLIWSLDQPYHSTGWGWRDLTWDGVFRDSTRIDTLYASVNDSVDKFGIDLINGTLDYYGAFPGPENPNRALAYNPSTGYFYTANFASPFSKFSKDSALIDTSITNTLSKYGGAYDSDSLEGNCLWWHTQDNGGLYIAQTDIDSMQQTGVSTTYLPSGLTDGLAGGLSYCGDFRNMDVLFALAQGNPVDKVVGIFLRTNLVAGIEDRQYADADNRPSIKLSSRIVNRELSFTVSLQNYADISLISIDGRTVKTFRNVKPGSVIDMDCSEYNAGIYFLKINGSKTSEKFTILK